MPESLISTIPTKPTHHTRIMHNKDKVFSLNRISNPPGTSEMRTGWIRWSCSLLVLLGVFLAACTEVEDAQPKGKFETGTGPLPAFELRLDTNRLNGNVRFDSIAEGGNFTIRFTPLTFGSIRIVNEGKAVEIQMVKSNWKADSTQYTITKNGVSRTGEIKIRNKSFFIPEPVDTSCIVMPIRTLYLNFDASLEIDGLFPTTGTVSQVMADFYTVAIATGGNLNYTASGGLHEQKWAWDTLRYNGETNTGRCVRGKIAIVLGDTCEPEAVEDEFLLPSGQALWPESALTANDRSCTGLLGNYLTRTDTIFDYGNYKVMTTRAGILTDTLVNGTQHYKYQRTSATIPEDEFFYYFKNNSSSRVTRAWVRIRF